MLISKTLPCSLVNPTTGAGTITAKVEAFAANSGGTYNATLASVSTTEYWTLSTTGNFTTSSVSLTRQTAITPLDAIAGSTSFNGTYTYLGGTAGANGVSTSNAIGSNTAFVLAGMKQTITTGTVPGSTFCSGTAGVIIPYVATGTYLAGNTFTAQLSDPSGSFASPTSIGSVSSLVSGTISTTVSSLLNGTGYRTRVISSSPAITGSDNGSDLTINLVPGTPTTSSASPSTIAYGAPGSITLIAGGGSVAGATLVWYNGGCGLGSVVGTGSPLTIPNPSVTTTYSARWENSTCYSPGCITATVTVTAPATMFRRR